jgi:voltage-gated potassium channel
MKRAPMSNKPQLLWQEWVVVSSLLATTPAFYIQMLAQLPTWVAGVVYGGAALVLAVMGHGGLKRKDATIDPWSRLDLALVFGLMAAALLPSSHVSTPAMLLRLVVAGLSLWRIVRSIQPLLKAGGMGQLLAVALAVFLSSALGFWYLEPRVETLGDALWLTFTTAATVGYGDIVPSTPASKVFAVFVVLMGYSTFSVLTAAIAAGLVRNEERQIEGEILRELHREVKLLREEIAELKAPPDQKP